MVQMKISEFWERKNERFFLCLAGLAFLHVYVAKEKFGKNNLQELDVGLYLTIKDW